jgi:SPP1 gp7 family putative phage head morphogenesis protein
MADTAHYQTDLKLEEMEKRLSAIYSRAEKEIQKTADEYFSKFAKQDEAKRKFLEQGKITEDEYKKWRKCKVMYGKRFTEMKEQCAKQLLNVNQTALAYVNGELPEVYAINYNALAGSVDGVGGYSFTLVDADTVRNLAVTDTSLLPYKELDPAKDIPWNMKKINAETLQGILQGESMDKISKRLRNVQEMNRTQAIRSARTIVTGAENKGRQDSYARAEADGIILQKEWLATNDGRTRHSHAALDGAIVDQDKKFDNGLMYPGDPSGRPEEVYNCRCSVVAKVNGFKKTTVKRVMQEREEEREKAAETFRATSQSVEGYGKSSPDGSMKTVRLYHGSQADFDKFDFAAGKAFKGGGADVYGEGFYFTADPSVARLYGDNIYMVEIKYSTDRRTAKKTGREKDFDYNPETGYWVIPKTKAENIRIVGKKRVE